MPKLKLFLTRQNAHRLLLAGIILLLTGAGITLQQVYAHPNAAPPTQASELHPLFAMLDAEGKNVQASGAPISTLQTCGQCHDTDYIANHSFHADLSSAKNELPWNPLTYRLVTPAGDARPDLDPTAWIDFNAARLTGGKTEDGLEMNCFLCHLTQPNNAERLNAIRNRQPEWAAAATLLDTGIVQKTGSTYTWNPAAFTSDGLLERSFVAIQDPSNANCGQCHGLVHTDAETTLALIGCELDNWQTATTGQIISAQKISLSGLNLAGKDSLSRSWDIHAERGLTCTDCHYSLNNPAYYQASADNRPSHLEFDPRRLELGEFLQKPNHNFARGQSAQTLAAAGETGSDMRACDTCHDTSSHTDWLPYTERHMAEVACQTCHIPQLYAPAIQSYDWTVLQTDGQPLTQCRGVNNQDNSGSNLNDLITGFEPALLQRSEANGKTTLAPYNLVSAWYWAYDTPNGSRPVRAEDLRTAWLPGGSYPAEIVQAFDSNSDGQISAGELRLDTPAKQDLIAKRLEALGVENPHIVGQVKPYSINHNIARGEWATRDCQSCHTSASRLSTPLQLSNYLPGGVTPQFVQDNNTFNAASPSSGLSTQNSALLYTPPLVEQGIYVFGHSRVNWIDWLGALLFVGVLFAVAGHGGLRFYRTLRRPHHQPILKRIYMYAVYERFWHWLQTFTIVLLLFTGLIIHRPDIFGWLSFPHMVTIHNILAAILVINAALSLFYHLVSGEIRQFIPRPYGFFDQAIVQAKFYLSGIFKGDPHPFEKTPDRKMNPLQQATYFGILNVLLPLQIITGALMWGVQRWPQIANWFGGLPFLAPFHSLIAWSFAAFIVAHIYLTTTSHEPLAGIKAMINGWEDIEEISAAHTSPENQPSAQAPQTPSGLEASVQ